MTSVLQFLNLLIKNALPDNNTSTVPITVSSNELRDFKVSYLWNQTLNKAVFFFVFAAILQFEKRISGRPFHPSSAAILITNQAIFRAFEVKDAFTKFSLSASVTTHGQSRAHQLLFVQDKGGRYLSCPTRSLHMHATLQVGGCARQLQKNCFVGWRRCMERLYPVQVCPGCTHNHALY